jgi:hypothetical protein
VSLGSPLSAPDEPTPMSTKHKSTSNDEVEEKESYSLMGRSILFLFIAGPGSVLAFGLWLRIGGTMSGPTGKVDMMSVMIFAFWLIGMIWSAISIFKR